MAFVSIGNLAGGGMVPDHPSYDLPPNVFNEGENIDFTVNGIAPMVDEVEVFAGMLANPFQLVKVKLGAEVEGWVYMDETDIYIIHGDVHIKITRDAGAGGEYSAIELFGWHEAILHGIPVFSNGRDVPQQMDPNNPTNLVTNLANWPSDLRAELIRPYKNFLVAINLQSGGGGAYDQQSLLWSAPADPGTVPPSWDYTDPATRAGLFTFSETDDRLVDGLVLGDEFIVYKERSIYAMRFIGGTFVMSIKRRKGDIGLLSKSCVVAFPQGHCFVGGDDIYVYNGAKTVSIGHGRIKRELFNTITLGQKNKIFVEHDTANKKIWVFYPTGGNVWCNRAAIWNYVNNTWTFRTLPNVSGGSFGEVNQIRTLTWDDFTATWEEDESAWLADSTVWAMVDAWDDQTSSDIWDPSDFLPVVENLVMATRLVTAATYDPETNMSEADGIVWQGGDAYPPLWLVPLDGVRKQGLLTKRSIAIVGTDHRGELEVNRTVRKILTEFYPEVEFGIVEVRVGTHDAPKGDIDWEEFQLFDAGLDEKLDVFVSGKYLAFELRGGSDTETNWVLSGYGMEINSGGRY